MKQLHKTAVISRCEKYRYKLTRTWDEDKGKVLFIMLNPSTANHIENDLNIILYHIFEHVVVRLVGASGGNKSCFFDF